MVYFQTRPKGITILEWLVILCILALIVAFFIPDTPRETKPTCLSNLKQIGLALHMYSMDNGGLFPESQQSFTALYPLYISGPKFFWCPSDANNSIPPTTINNWETDGTNSSQISYTYIPGFSQKDGDTIILKDNIPANHENKGVHVLYGNGRVEWVPAEMN